MKAFFVLSTFSTDDLRVLPEALLPKTDPLAASVNGRSAAKQRLEAGWFEVGVVRPGAGGAAFPHQVETATTDAQLLP